MIRSAYVAGFTALLLLFGHIAIFVILYTLAIPPDAQQEITNIVTPVTVAAFVSATLYVVRRKDMRPEQSGEVNYLFAIFTSVVPLVMLLVVCVGLLKVESRQDIEELKGTIATAEAIFGGVFVLLIDAVFGHASKGTESGDKESNFDGVSPTVQGNAEQSFSDPSAKQAEDGDTGGTQ